MANLDTAPAVLKRGGAADQILADLSEQILQGKLPRGTKLPSERDLAQQYHVSGPTVREAVRGLAAVSLVEVRHGAGTYVTAATDTLFAMATSALIELENVKLVEILDVLEPLNAKTAVLACEHASDAELASLSTALDALDAAEKPDEIAARLGIFLGLLADASHNALMSAMCKFLVTVLIEVAREETGGRTENWDKVAGKLGADRRNLVDALQARDVVRATNMTLKYHRRTRALINSLAVTDDDAATNLQRAFKRMRQGTS